MPSPPLDGLNQTRAPYGWGRPLSCCTCAASQRSAGHALSCATHCSGLIHSVALL